MVEEFLAFSGISVVGVENGVEGLTRLRESRPSVILLDLTMPVMDGWRFREEQVRLPDATLAAIPVVSRSALHDCQREADRLGAVDVIPNQPSKTQRPGEARSNSSRGNKSVLKSISADLSNSGL
jgi:CheY-like chemotaxis protein